MKNLAVHFFLPHESNNFRPRTLHFSAIIFYIVLFLLLQFSFRVLKLTRPDILGFATDINVEQLLNLTNLKRAESGLSSLNLDSQLSTAAQAKANDMFAKGYWAHNAPDGTTPWVFINQAGYQYIYAGENLAKDFGNSTGVVDAWMNSSSHRENILKKEYQDVGFAVVNNRLAGEETTLVVQMFGTKQPSMVASKPVTISPEAALAPTVNEAPFPSPTPQASPGTSPTPLPTSISMPNLPPMVLSSLRVAGVTQRPMVNFFNMSKDMASILTALLMIILVSDGIFIWRKKIVRISGHNLAHIIFLASLLGALWITSQGAVL